MTTPRNILVFMGTRPEAVKLAPVVAALRDATDFRCTVVATGQHKEMFRFTHKLVFFYNFSFQS